MRRCALVRRITLLPFPEARTFLYTTRRRSIRRPGHEIGATQTGNSRPAEGEVDEEENGEAAVAAAAAAVATTAGAMAQTIPTRYRWISTPRPSPDAPPGDKPFLSFLFPRRYCRTVQLRPTPTGITKWR